MSNNNNEMTARIMRETLHFARIKNISSALQMIKKIEMSLEATFEKLHKQYGPYKLFKQGMDQHTKLHKKLYELHQEVASEYFTVAKLIISEVIKEPCFIQKVPTYRFGLPNNRWVGAYHLDSDFGHSKFELNCILAFTNMFNTNALQVEVETNSYKYKPMEISKGELILFNHIDRRHGCSLNRERVSVASIDFRFIPERFAISAFKNTSNTINTKMQLLPGEYFSSQPIPVT